MIYSKNVLLETAKNSAQGWLKELCYQTLSTGELDEAHLQQVFDIFVKKGDAVSAIPAVEGNQALCLCSLQHVEGVNALQSNNEIIFCEDGLTIISGQNGTGKSGYFRVLEHMAGGNLAKPILSNIYNDHPVQPKCKVKYSIGGNPTQEYEWKNAEEDKGRAPFNRLTVFNSTYAEQYIKRFSPGTYTLEMYGLSSYNHFQENLTKLTNKVQAECPTRIEELRIKEINDLNIDAVLRDYYNTLQIHLESNIQKILGRLSGITVELVWNEQHPELRVKLDKPCEVESVLSEGEQKAIALALLLSDAELKEEKNPIILDDPISSLDNKIVCNLVEILIGIENQVIIFSHNPWFVERFLTSQKCKVYKNSTRLAGMSPKKRHIFAYTVESFGGEKGIITEYAPECAQLYLNTAKLSLDVVPFTTGEKERTISALRKSVEHLVDEKIFLSLVPCKYRTMHPNIPWLALASLSAVPQSTIDVLQEQYAKLSERATHLGMAHVEDPLDHDDLQEIYDKLILL